MRLTPKQKAAERMDLMRSVIRRVAVTHPMLEQPNDARWATDEEVRDFIRMFMRFQISYNHNYTSYGLKHIAERTIGFLFHGSSSYSYVSNDQFKRIMSEDEFSLFGGKPDRKDSDLNHVYCFRWTTGALETFFDFGIQGMGQPAIRDVREK